MSSDDLLSKVQNVEATVAQARKGLEEISERLELTKKDILGGIRRQIEEARYTKFNPDELPSFLEEPYLILPKRMSKGQAVEWFLIVPRFIDFQVGYLERSTKSYNLFIINQYVNMLKQSELPEELQHLFHLDPLPVKVEGNLMETPPEKQEEAWLRYRKHLVKRESDTEIKIKRGSEFQLIAQIIEDGYLPFMYKKVDQEDLRPPKSGIVLRDYQEEAWNELLNRSALGLFWPYGIGKSIFGIYLCDCLKGPKLIIVPELTNKEQWMERIVKFLPPERRAEIEVQTYLSYHKVKDKKYVLTIYEECHHLPAPTYIKLSTINTKYRVGLSGSPYREDGKVNYIMALTGYPMGLNWAKYFELGIIKKPNVNVFIVSDLRAKRRKLDDLMTLDTGKTLIYSDSIALGTSIAEQHGLEFVSGQTTNRLEKIRSHEKIVVSRVGDEGMSIPDIDTIIEVDFLFGSRRQESQRVGRLLHSQKEAINHYILMTEEELNHYGKRLFSLYEKGFNVRISRVGG